MSTSCCCGQPAGQDWCGCCEGTAPRTPLPTANRPGLPALAYRAGTHATFLETMKARLSSRDFPALAPLTTREASDAAIALLDAWATVADVLTFYQERIANEGFLATATERRSIVELARLVGYRPRPGVAASVYLAYTIDSGFTEQALIPAGSRVQSVPGPGETAQSFETSEDIVARAAWNDLRPRLTQPQTEASIRCGDGQWAHVFLAGTATNLKPNDPLLIAFGSGRPEFFRVRAVTPDAAAKRTRVTMQAAAVCDPAAAPAKSGKPPASLVGSLALGPSVPPASAKALARSLHDQFRVSALGVEGPPALAMLDAGDASYGAAKVFTPALASTLTRAAVNADVTPGVGITVYALRQTASVFGHNAQKRVRVSRGEVTVVGDWPVIEQVDDLDTFIRHEQEQVIHLDGRHDAILPDSWIAVQLPDHHELAPAGDVMVLRARRPNALVSRAEYGLSGPATRIELETPWIILPDRASQGHDDFAMIRQTAVYAQADVLELAEEPILQPVCGGHDDLIELDGFYEDLEAGRWVVVSGERELESTSGVRFSELSMLSSVSHGVRMLPPSPGGTSPRPLAGDRTHTFIELHGQLAYCFKRDTVKIHGNVVLATHGETRTETLGSGDGGVPNQEFVLKQAPLTYVPADVPSGVATTLKVYVNDVQWREADALVGLLPADRRLVTRTGDDGRTAVVFGNGREGARLPTGTENVKAVYCSGIGRAGNVKAEQISLLTTRPLGARAVVNPLPASGGADRETRDQARRNVPLAVMALDRLVSVQDYEDFARVFAGIGKARAVELSDGRRRLVHLTIAGAADAPIDATSALFRHLTAALRRFGDPDQAFQVDVRELLLLVLSARVRVHPDHRWDRVEPLVRAALLEAFGFERRELGEDALLSVAVSAMQAVRGVEWVDVDVFGGVPERVPSASGRRLLEPGEISRAIQTLVSHDLAKGPSPRVRVDVASLRDGGLRPAQIAVVSPLVPATLILNEVPR